MKKVYICEDIITDKWFAWYPVRTISGKWKFWNYVTRTVDERPIQYQGLLAETTYEEYSDKKDESK